ncbi:MAG: REP-associated tyrosine transposase [Lysobacterales bacterium]
MRKGRVSIPEQAYLVTTVCQDRTPVFLDASLAVQATALLNSALAWPNASVEAWVLMPDHWHGLVVLTSDEPLSRVVQRFKALVSRQLPRPQGQTRRLWQRGFHDHALRNEASLVKVARYVVDNPVRAGLCARWSDWPHRGGQLISTLDPADPMWL